MDEEFEDINGVIRIRKSKDRQHNDQKKKYRRMSDTITNKKRSFCFVSQF
jgi:hypothetical protein